MRTAYSPPLERRTDIEARIERINWNGLENELDQSGNATVVALLRPSECDELATLYDESGFYRSRVVMSRHGFGRGEYRYYDYPLPKLVDELRRTAYARLAPIANRWSERLGESVRYPPTLDEFTQRCHRADQRRPTPLILRYDVGDYNCLHQDVYGEQVFPLQLAVLLSEPERDFTGGEFVMTEQRPRMQSRCEVVPLRQGDAVIFAVNGRPVQGSRGTYQVKLRHGVSRLRSGRRHALGVIFHDAS